MEAYQSVRILGEGSFGRVYLMKHLPTDRDVCVKAVKAEDGEDDAGGAHAGSCLQEVETMRRLCHPNVVRYQGSFRSGKSLFLVMQFADGGDLGARIRAAAKAQTPFPEGQALQWLAQLCLGLQHMHGRHVLHRDIKPQNILLCRGDRRILIGDVGISKELASTMDQAATAIGTPSYLAPEVFQNRPYSFAADVWSLGCVAFELATLRQAFAGQSIADVSLRVCAGRCAPMGEGVSTALRDVVMEMLQVNAARRPTLAALLRSRFLARHIEAYAQRAVQELDAEGDADGAETLRRQVAEECGLNFAAAAAAVASSSLPASTAAAAGALATHGGEAKLQRVLARLRKQRQERQSGGPNVIP